MPSELDYAYLAGFFDGEGHISIHFYLYPYNKHMLSINTIVQVGMAYYEKTRLKEIQEFYGGKFYIPLSKRDCVWSLRNRDLQKQILPRMLPYMHFRRKQAELLLKALQILSNRKDTYTPRPKEDILKIAKLSEEISNLNGKQGPPLKWTYDYIKEFIEDNHYYGEERRKHLIDQHIAWGKISWGKSVKVRKEKAVKRAKTHPLYDKVVVLRKQGLGWRVISKTLNIDGNLARSLIRYT